MIPDRVLRQHLAGALDPPEREQVERALASDPALRERLALLLATTHDAPAPGLAPTGAGLAGWVVPPPAARTLGGSAAPVAVMGGAEGTGWVVLRLDVSPEQLDHRVVVLERTGAEWDVVFPCSADEECPARALPREGGQLRIDVATAGAGRAHRIAAVLVPPAPPLDWTLPPVERWARVRDALAAGELPAVAFDMG
jgi:hypothetical protein